MDNDRQNVERILWSVGPRLRHCRSSIRGKDTLSDGGEGWASLSCSRSCHKQRRCCRRMWVESLHVASRVSSGWQSWHSTCFFEHALSHSDSMISVPVSCRDQCIVAIWACLSWVERNHRSWFWPLSEGGRYLFVDFTWLDLFLLCLFAARALEKALDSQKGAVKTWSTVSSGRNSRRNIWRRYIFAGFGRLSLPPVQRRFHDEVLLAFKTDVVERYRKIYRDTSRNHRKRSIGSSVCVNHIEQDHNVSKWRNPKSLMRGSF